MTDEDWMRAALKLAKLGQGAVEPNPLVGAVVVANDVCVAEGWHERFGGPHAEIVAMRKAGAAAKDATLYVTLEPCNHFGKTPPCVDSVIAAGIRRVVVAMVDPFPQVAGQGIARLRQAGIAVDVGKCEADAARLNRPYLTLVEKARPHVHFKWAMTLDGKLATKTRDSKWISNEASRKIVHELRGRMDAIIVGANTVRFDDPLLTARPTGPRTASRIVLTSKGELPTGCQLLRTAMESPVIVATCDSDAKPQPHVESLILPSINGRPSVAALLQELGRRRMTNVLVEGGAAVFGSFRDAGLVDEIHAFIAPKIVGSTDAPSPIGGSGIEQIADAWRLVDCQVQNVDGDVYLRGSKD